MGGKGGKKKTSRKKKHVRSENTLANTTEEILKQCRTNPHANVRLSGKKQKKLDKLAKREMKKKMGMEVVKNPSSEKKLNAPSILSPPALPSLGSGKMGIEKMET